MKISHTIYPEVTLDFNQQFSARKIELRKIREKLHLNVTSNVTAKQFERQRFRAN